MPDSQPGVGFLSVSWASLDPADPGSGSLGTGLLEGPAFTALCSPRHPPPFSLGESTQGACSPQGHGRVPPLPGSLMWLMGRARSEVLPLYGMRARRGTGRARVLKALQWDVPAGLPLVNCLWRKQTARELRPWSGPR